VSIKQLTLCRFIHRQTFLKEVYEANNQARKRANYKCEVCHDVSHTASYSGHKIIVHHIDGNYLNNSPENLKVLCPSCHLKFRKRKKLMENEKKE